MANGHDEFFLSLVNRFREINLAKGGKNALLNYVYRQIEPEPRERYSSIKVNVFDASQSGDVENLTVGNPATRRTPYVDPAMISLSYHAVYHVPLYSVNLAKAATNGGYVNGVRDMASKKIADYMNERLAALITPTNFADYTPVDTGIDGDIPDSAMANAWGELADNDIAVGDFGNLFLVTSPNVYKNLLQRESWTQTTYLDADATGIRRTARLGTQWGAFVDWDPDVGLYQSSAGVYTSLLFHRHAMGLVSAPLPPPMDSGVPTTYVTIGGIPVRVTIAWDTDYRCDVLTFDCLFGVGTIRSDHGILLANTA